MSAEADTYCAVNQCYREADIRVDHPGRPHEAVTPVCNTHATEALRAGATEVNDE